MEYLRCDGGILTDNNGVKMSTQLTPGLSNQSWGTLGGVSGHSTPKRTKYTSSVPCFRVSGHGFSYRLDRARGEVRRRLGCSRGPSGHDPGSRPYCDCCCRCHRDTLFVEVLRWDVTRNTSEQCLLGGCRVVYP